MPTSRTKRSRKTNLKPAEVAFLENNENFLRPGERDKRHYNALCDGWDLWMLFGHSTRRMLFAAHPEYRDSLVERFGPPPEFFSAHVGRYYEMMSCIDDIRAITLKSE